MDILFDILFEILFEGYAELMFLIVPEKRTSKKHLIISKVVAIVVFLAVIALFVWGIILIADYNNLVGIVPISFAAVISLVQITLGIVMFVKNHPT